jgi:AcrR family transcriptional regulator
MARHAHALEDKLARRREILDAARHLFGAGAGDLPGVSEIAAAAGLAKGTLYLYFRTREEIFCELIVELWLDMLGEIGAVFETAKGPRTAIVAAHIDHLSGYLERFPEILRLDSLAYSLERNVDPHVRHEQNLRFAACVEAVGARADNALRLPPGRGVQILMRSYALMRGLWQMTHHQQRSGVAVDPVLAPLFPAFAPTLRQALEEYWRGALAAPRQAP